MKKIYRGRDKPGFLDLVNAGAGAGIAQILPGPGLGPGF